MAARRVLINVLHPNLATSRANRLIVDELRQLPGATVRDVQKPCPDWKLDVAREQERLLAHDLIVFQHPFYWYSCPALWTLRTSMPTLSQLRTAAKMAASRPAPCFHEGRGIREHTVDLAANGAKISGRSDVRADATAYLRAVPDFRDDAPAGATRPAADCPPTWPEP